MKLNFYLVYNKTYTIKSIKFNLKCFAKLIFSNSICNLKSRELLYKLLFMTGTHTPGKCFTMTVIDRLNFKYCAKINIVCGRGNNTSFKHDPP